MSLKPKLAVAIDVESRSEVFAWADKLEGLPLVLKLGLRNLPQLLPEDIQSLKTLGFEIFVDAKLHDIPTQVASAVKNYAALGADYITVHLSGGSAMLSKAARVAAGKTRILGVSLLTSMSADDLQNFQITASAEEYVQSLIRVGYSSGVQSFVCSVQELRGLKEFTHEHGYPQGFFVTPGLTMAGEKSHADQKRTATVEEAIAMGVNLLVVGRSILNDANPRAKAEKIIKLLEAKR